MAQRVQVTFEAEDVPAIGYQVYVLKEVEESLAKDIHELIETTDATSKDKEFVMENENVFVRINLDGSFDLTDKKTGHTFENCGIYEDTGDMGNEYIYIQDTDRQTITTRNIPATIFVEENSAIRSVVKVRHELEVPEAIGDEILPQRYSCVDLYQRKAKRSEKLVKLSIETTLTLEHHAKGVKVQTTVVNTAKDHRLRVLFPAGLDSDMHFADSTFEVVRRPNRHGKAWTNPSACEHEQCFVAMEDKNAGILVANRGLYEYEILPDEENTIALTLLRSVAEMGDWGYFPTPQAQMQGSYTLEYAIFPYEPEMCAEAFALGYGYQHDLAGVQLGMNREKETIFTPQAQSGILPIRKSFFEWKGNGLNLTAFKKGANSEDIFVRFVNTLETDVKLTIKKADWMKGIYQSSVIEEKKETIDEENGVFSVVIKPYQIATFGLQPKER
jgi:alpha-mannosidase